MWRGGQETTTSLLLLVATYFHDSVGFHLDLIQELANYNCIGFVDSTWIWLIDILGFDLVWIRLPNLS